MKYQIIHYVGGKWSKDETNNIFAWAAARGLPILKHNDDKYHRAELQGQPIISSLYGPMWGDSGIILYEDRSVTALRNRHLLRNQFGQNGNFSALIE
jgi:hypothetical protein